MLYETVVLDMERVKLLESDKAVRFVLDQVTFRVPGVNFRLARERI